MAFPTVTCEIDKYRTLIIQKKAVFDPSWSYRAKILKAMSGRLKDIIVDAPGLEELAAKMFDIAGEEIIYINRKDTVYGMDLRSAMQTEAVSTEEIATLGILLTDLLTKNAIPANTTS